MILIPYDSELWTIYKGAYGNMCEDVKIVMGDIMDISSSSKLERLDLEEKNDYETAYENLWANLLHQADFYEATYIVMPYMVKFLEKNEGNFDRLFSMISNIGLCLAADIPYYTRRINKTVLSSYESVYKSYESAVSIIRDKTKDFIRNNFEEIKAKDSDEKWMFSLSVMAILLDRETAYEFYMTDWEEGCIRIKCDKCGYDDENNYVDDESFLKSITPAPPVQWDGINYDNTYAWFGSFLRDLEVEEADLVPYLYGIYTCPECGEKKMIIDFMKSELSD